MKSVLPFMVDSNGDTAFHKSNPSSIPKGLWIHTLGHVGGGNRCGGDILLKVMSYAG